MASEAVILDCFTVEPSGLGVPPYLSTYVRESFSAIRGAIPGASVAYLTIDDVRWCLNGHTQFQLAPLSDPLTYSATINRDEAITKLRNASTVVIIAGDAVPSVHLHAQNGSPDEIARALACVRGNRILVGPLANDTLVSPKKYTGLFDAVHTHTVTSRTLFGGSRQAPSYDELAADRTSFEDLIPQMRWTPIAEIELYRGCTRRRFCSFCNEPVKSRDVVFREPGDIISEMKLLYHAGVRNFRLGQQTCFFSYKFRSAEAIEALLYGIREACPELEVLHIDNADPLAVASSVGRRIAALVATHCTEGNCAPMGIESFDPVVAEKNVLICTPEVIVRATTNINEFGTKDGPLGFPTFLPGLNLIYGLPGETHRTHFENLKWLTHILESGLQCHRTNVRQVRPYPGTPLAMNDGSGSAPPSSQHFETWKADIDNSYDQPMKKRVYPVGRRLAGLHSFFVSSRGTWHRRLGSYSLQVVERDVQRSLYQPSSLRITDHAPRFVYGLYDAEGHSLVAA